MKQCGNCGREIPDDEAFCANCISETNDNGKVEDLNSRIPVRASAPKTNKANKNIIIASFLAVLLLAGSFFGWRSYTSEARAQEKLELAIKYLSENDFDKAILAFNDAIEINPKEIKAYQGLARTYTLQGRFADAKAVYDKGLQAVSSDQKQTLQIGLAGMYIDQGNISEAEKAFLGLKENNPACLEAYFGLAIVYQRQGDNAKAESVLRQAVEKNPGDYRAYNTLALFLEQNQKRDEAFQNLVKSLELDINQQEAYLILNSMYNYRWGEVQAKIASVSNQQVASMLEFCCYYYQQNYSKAVSLYKQNHASQTSNIKVKILAAVAMSKTGDRAGAENLIAQCLAAQMNGWLFGDIASYYLEAGNKDKAKEFAINALQANGTNLEAIALLQEINADDGSVRIYAAEYLLYNWQPVNIVKENLAVANVDLACVSPDEKIISFIRANYPGAEDPEKLIISRFDLTGDQLPEFVLSHKYAREAFVLQYINGSYHLLYHDQMGRYGYKTPYIDTYGDLYLTPISGGTGVKVEMTSILRWDGTQLREIWSEPTVENSYQAGMPGNEWYEKSGSATISGNGKPERLSYVLKGVYGHYAAGSVKMKERNDTSTREYQFNEQQFKFIEVSAKTDEQILTTAGNIPDELFFFKGATIGMGEDQIKSLIGDSPGKSNVHEGIYWWDYPDSKIIFDSKSRKVTTIFVYANNKSAGIKPGDPVKKVIDAYGKGEIGPTEWGDPSSKNYTLSYKKDGNRKISFLITNDIIGSVIIGERIFLMD